MAIVSEIQTKFNFVGNIDALKNFNKESKDGISNSKKFSRIALGFGAAVVGAGIKGIRSDSEIRLWKQREGISDKLYQKNKAAAILAGATAKEFDSMHQSITGQIQDAAAGGGGDLFGHLSISIRDANEELKNSQTILEEIRRGISSGEMLAGMSIKEQAAVLRKYGFSENIIHGLLQQSDSQREGLTDGLDIRSISEAERKALINANNELNLTGNSWSTFFDAMGASIAPDVSSIARGATHVGNAPNADAAVAIAGFGTGLGTISKGMWVIRGGKAIWTAGGAVGKSLISGEGRKTAFKKGGDAIRAKKIAAENNRIDKTFTKATAKQTTPEARALAEEMAADYRSLHTQFTKIGGKEMSRKDIIRYLNLRRDAVEAGKEYYKVSDKMKEVLKQYRLQIQGGTAGAFGVGVYGTRPNYPDDTGNVILNQKIDITAPSDKVGEEIKNQTLRGVDEATKALHEQLPKGGSL